MPRFSNFATALLRTSRTNVFDGAVLDDVTIEGHNFKIVVHQPHQRPTESAPWKVRYELRTTHRVGGFGLDPEHLAEGIRSGVPFISKVLALRGGRHAALGDPTDVGLTDFLESIVIDDVTISIHHKHGFDDEFGDEPGFNLVIRRGREQHPYKIDSGAIATAAASSDLFLAHALDWAPDAAAKLSEWLASLPDVKASYVSDLEQKELDEMIDPPTSSPRGKGSGRHHP